MRTLLAHRDARFYLAGQVLSTVGDNALWLAMGIWVKILTGSSSAAGLVFFAFTCGILLAPVTGLVADRMRRRRPRCGCASRPRLRRRRTGGPRSRRASATSAAPRRCAGC